MSIGGYVLSVRLNSAQQQINQKQEQCDAAKFDDIISNKTFPLLSGADADAQSQTRFRHCARCIRIVHLAAGNFVLESVGQWQTIASVGESRSNYWSLMLSRKANP
jgi:hypothetical protein